MFSYDSLNSLFGCWFVQVPPVIRFSQGPLWTTALHSIFNSVFIYCGIFAHSKNCTVTVAGRNCPVNKNRGMVFSARPVLMVAHATIRYIMPPLSNNCTATEASCFLWGPCRDVISWKSQSNCRGSVVVKWCCEKLVAGAGEKGERPPFDAATSQRLAKTVTDRKDLVCLIVICEMCRTVSAYSLLVVTSCKCSIKPITNSSLVCSH
jgi:hypothetical protein